MESYELGDSATQSLWTIHETLFHLDHSNLAYSLGSLQCTMDKLLSKIIPYWWSLTLHDSILLACLLFWAQLPCSLHFLCIFLFHLLGTVSISMIVQYETYSTKHKLMSYDSQCKVVNSCAMVLSHDDFWRHVSCCSASVTGIVRLPYSSQTKVCYFHITFTI